MQDLQSEIQTLIEAVSAWAEANPLPLMLALGVIAILLIVLLALLLRSRRAAPPPPAPQVEPDAVAEPVAVSEETAPEVVSERAATPMPAPEPVYERETVPEPVPEPAPAPLPPPARLRDRLRLTSEHLVGRLGELIGGRTVDAEVLEDLEMLLFSADLGVQTAESLLEAVRAQASGADAGTVRGVLRQAILEKLQRVEPKGEPLATQGKPHVILVFGVNGSGKTTTIGKLAARYKEAGYSVILGAGDTFRAAASEQLQSWGERVGCDVVSGPSGGDPSAVAFDTVKAAVARKIDVAIVDTAGRLQTQKPLMEELSKLVRVTGRDLPGAPHESLLVLDSNTGQNAISQARLFSEAANVTGLVLTKLDGTAKGGVLIGLADEFGIPVKFVGVGEAIDDLRDFSAEEFVEAVFEE
jgi:fused signal recognition particle receptor